MTAVFTVTGGDAATLVDDGSRLFGQIYNLGGQAREQVTALFRATHPARFMRGNVAGQCVFAAWKSFGSAAEAAGYLAAEYGRLNQEGILKLTVGSTILTMAQATLSAVAREEWEGCYMRVRYTFGIGSLEGALDTD